MSDSKLQSLIEAAYADRARLTPESVPAEVRAAVEEVLTGLDAGRLRVAEKIAGAWQTHQWIKKAVLLSFRLQENSLTAAAGGAYYDKVPLKFAGYTAERFAAAGLRVCPGAVVRHGAYIAPGAVLMPSFVNLGAYVGADTMIDTWATVGSCAQVGSHVHIAGGAGIGGVLEPVQDGPTVIEDHCFIGARSEVVEGCIVGEGSVISMGVFLGKSTRIYDRATGEISYGRVPPGSVVVAGNLPSADGRYALYAAIIVKHVDARTLSKVALNDLLRAAQGAI